MRTNRHNTGKPFEGIIETVATQYAAKRFMRLRKVDPPLRYAGGRIIHLPNPFPDYVGAWTERGGRAIFIEAKSTREPKLPVGKSGLTSAQVEALHAWTVAGAAAFLLWECRGCVRLWTEPMIVDQTLRAKHLSHVMGHPVAPGVGWVMHDFRRTMITVWPDGNGI